MLKERSGIVVTEVLVSLVLSMIVLSLIATTVLSQSRLARGLGERIAYNDAARATLHILPAELRLAGPNDVRAVSADSVSGRWVRSSGVVCFTRAPDVWLRLRGIREPDPAKDSLLLIGDSTEVVLRMSFASHDASKCAAVSSEDVYRVRFAGNAAPPAGVVLIFESGNYYLSQRALRYRLGGEGRQPLTEEYLRDGVSSLAYAPADSVLRGHIHVTVGLKTQMQHSAGRIVDETFYLPNTGFGK